MNRISIKGKVGRVDEVCFVTPKGHLKANFSIADNRQDSPVWFEIEAWEHLATQAIVLKKGLTVDVDGYVKKVEIYQSKDGKPQPKITIGLLNIVEVIDLDSILTFKAQDAAKATVPAPRGREVA